MSSPILPTTFFLRCVVCSLVSSFLFVAELPAEPVSDGEKLFALKVKPLFVEKCHACHGSDPDKIEGGFNMSSRESMLDGGDAFGDEVLISGNGKASLLYVATTRKEPDYEMPPKESEKLTQEQTWWIRDWINEGAPWPNDERIAAIRAEYDKGEVVKTSGGLSDDWTNRRYEPQKLWAYRPLKVANVPAGRNPVDWFVDRKLAEVGLAPAPTATANELLRRMSFGLTGLPPDPDNEAIKQFLKSHSSNAGSAAGDFAKHLMSRPQYGEHFGRQWLDVTRYADSAGFANDYARPNAWRYRDYVVRSFNQDKPYDEFVRQQIAGDELHADNENPTTESIIATGFLRMGPWEQTGMSVFRITRQQWLDDVTDSVGQTFLAQPLQCCKCHDHKFDPLPTRDYYSMMAVFSTTQFAERNAPFMKPENKSDFAAANAWTEAKLSGYKQQQSELNKKIAERKKPEVGDAKVGDNGLDPSDEASFARMRKNIERHSWELDKTKPIALAVYTGKTIERKMVKTRTRIPADPWSKGTIEQDTILEGGDAYSRGEAVQPAALSAAIHLGEMNSNAFPTGKGKRRAALADWIVGAKNPLTARVMVNRVWGWHFGKGIAANPNNFGGSGGLPTHPELLDYLADWFMRNDWSVKKLNALIVGSKAYRRSAAHPVPDELATKDPKHDYYATFLPRRLTAEELRDAMLAASGELNQQVGGIPCRPEINPEVAIQPRQVMGGTASAYEPDSSAAQRNRRSIYAEKIRGLRDPFFETFNQPGSDKSCELRETSTVAPQALTLLNAEMMQSRALAFAARLLKEQKKADKNGETPAGQTAVIRRAFELSLGRLPTNDEERKCLSHWVNANAEESNRTYAPKEYAAEATRTATAEKTGERYDFLEKMPAFEDYEPDLQAHQVDAQTRGLAQVCLVLFNLNEFAYLD